MQKSILFSGIHIQHVKYVQKGIFWDRKNLSKAENAEIDAFSHQFRLKTSI